MSGDNMNQLSDETFNDCILWIQKNGRPLEQKILNYSFFNGEPLDVINELKKYQNVDGGFGNALESDFRLPKSSPKATSIGLRLLSNFDKLYDTQLMIEEAVGYLEDTYDTIRHGWFIASKDINYYPHAPWWHYNQVLGSTLLDLDLGNPSAEIVGQLYKYKKYIKKLNLDEILSHLTDYFNLKKSFIHERKKFVKTIVETEKDSYIIDYFKNEPYFDSKGEIFCFIKLYFLNSEVKKKIHYKLQEAIEQLVEYNINKWDHFVLKPLDVYYENNPFMINIDSIELQLDYIIYTLEKYKKAPVTWSKNKNYYDFDLSTAYNEWVGQLTLGMLQALNKHRRLNRCYQC